jgi:hypothetical protein
MNRRGISRMNVSPQEGGSRAAHAAAASLSDDEDLDLEFSEEKDLAMSDMRERHANRHHQSSPEIKSAGTAKKKLQPISEGRPQQDFGNRGQKKDRGAATKREAAADLRRNNRVVAIREQAGRRPGSRKTG